MAGNQALNINQYVGPQADLAITNHGSDWYWTVCAIMTVSTLGFMGLSFTKPRTHRLFHYLAAGITLVAAISYYSMGAGLGQVPIQAEFVRPGSAAVSAAGTREVFWVRYVDWAITVTLILLATLATAGAPATSIIITALAGETMVVTGLVGALTQTSYKWGYAVFGFFAFLYVGYSLLMDGRRQATPLGSTIGRTYSLVSGLVLFFGFLYPIAWGVSEGGNVIHPDSEAIFYGILDLFTKAVFGFVLVFGHRNIDPAELGFNFRDLTVGAGEKTNGHHNGVHNGVNNGVNNGTTAV